MGFDIDELKDDEEESDDQRSSNETGLHEQKKTLIAHSYSTTYDDKYSDLDDWGLSQEQVRMLHKMYSTSTGSGALKGIVSALTESGDHEEFYNELQLAIAHAVYPLGQLDDFKEMAEFEEYDIEPQGSIPVMEFFQLDSDDIIQYLDSREDEGEMAEEVYEQLHAAATEDDGAEESDSGADDETEGTDDEADEQPSQEGSTEQPEAEPADD